MSKHTLEEEIKHFDAPHITGIKLPTGETIPAGSATVINSGTKDQLKRMEEIPTIDLPPLEESDDDE